MGRIIILILMHTIGDFFFQGSKLSRLKAIKVSSLFEHVGIYTTFFLVLSPVLLGLTILQGVVFSLSNGALHLVIDYFTGKLKTKYFESSESKYMATVGLDHTLHLLILIGSFVYFFPEALNSNFGVFFK